MTTDVPASCCLPADPAGVVYTCPGEDHPISRSVHLSRLAAFYPACRDCPHNEDTGGLAAGTLDRLARTRRRVARPTLFSSEGVRGVHRNELTRGDAGRLAAALGWLLWQERPAAVAGSQPARRPEGPTLVVGHDARPSGIDLVTGVIASLVRSGCRLIEIGRVSRPCFIFAVDHLRADAGLLVTGAGRGPAWTGLEAVTAAGRPLSRDDGLERWETRTRLGHSRPARRGGHRRRFEATEIYEATLRRHFTPTRPLVACVFTSPGPLAETLARLFEPLPWSIELAATPSRDAPRRLAARISERGADLGLICDDDDGRVQVFDESGRRVGDREVARLLATLVLSESPGQAVVLTRGRDRQLDQLVRRLGGRPRRIAGTTRAAAWRAIREHQAVLGLAEDGEIWFHESTPTCDSVLVLARLFTAVDRNHRPLSQMIAREACGS